MLPVLAAFALCAAQQSEERILSPEEELAGTQAPTWRANFGVKELFDADFDSTPGELGLRRWSASLNYSFPVGDWRLGLTPYGREYDFRFAGRTPFGRGAPFGDVHFYGFDVDATAPLADNLEWYASAALEHAQESGARLGAYSQKFLSFVGWELSENFTLFLGGFHLQGIEENITVPIVGFDWDFWEELGLVSDEDGTRLEYRPSDRLRLDLGFDGDVFQARLNPSAAAPNGVLQYVELDVGVRAVWEPSDGLRLIAGALVEAFADVELQNSNGGFRGSDQLEPAPVLFLSLRLTF